jgi:2-phospho-L-lactate guanylyltransferase (CobY/MobA/RfbA family)
MKAQSIRKMQDLLKDPNIKDKADIARRLAGYLDAIVRENSAFGSFEDLVKARGGYVPSIEVIEDDKLVLADAYDAHMIENGDDRRAYRYGARVDNQAFKVYRKIVREARA